MAVCWECYGAGVVLVIKTGDPNAPPVRKEPETIICESCNGKGRS